MDTLYKTLLDDSRILVFVKDENLNIVYANKAFLELYAPDVRPHVVGLSSHVHFQTNEARVFNSEDHRAFEQGFAELVEEITDYTGRVRILHSRKVRYEGTDGKPLMLGVSLDISEQAEREKALARSNVLLENFAAIAAHDLRSPLGAMQAAMEAIRTDHDTVLGTRAKAYMTMMDASVRGLIDQVATLLRMFKSKHSAGMQNMECDVAVLLEEVRFNLSQQIEQRDARVLSEYLPKIVANKPLFRQLLHNLIENSLKHHPDHTQPTIILRYRLEDGLHKFALEDNGSGMPADMADTLFDLGVQHSAEGAANSHGIGLALCRDVVARHNGRIWVDTDYQYGCRICFDIPLNQGDVSAL